MTTLNRTRFLIQTKDPEDLPMNQKYSPEFKESSMKLVLEPGQPVSQTAHYISLNTYMMSSSD